MAKNLFQAAIMLNRRKNAQGGAQSQKFQTKSFVWNILDATPLFGIFYQPFLPVKY
jgi:hypothetical protein